MAVLVGLALLAACGEAVGDAPTVRILDFFGALGNGKSSIQGTVELSEAASTARTATVKIVAPTYATGSSVVLPAGVRRVNFVATAITGGTYTVLAEVDLNGDTRTDERDLAGYLGGTREEPVLTQDRARTVTVSGTDSVTGLAFGIGRVGACLLPAGSACSADAQCRGVQCRCGPGEGADAGVTYGILGQCANAACVDQTSRCEETCQGRGLTGTGAGECQRYLD